jgi:hypothetical protein
VIKYALFTEGLIFYHYSEYSNKNLIPSPSFLEKDKNFVFKLGNHKVG